MINLGLSGPDHRALLNALTDVGTKIRVKVEIRNFAGDVLAEVSDHLIDGQVDIDATADVTRALTLVLTDVKRRLPFDSRHPSRTALYFDRMIRVRYDVLVPNVGWVEIPVFTGPVTRLSRTGALVTVEARGKEIFFLGAAWHVTSLRKHMKATDAITLLLTDRNPFYTEHRLTIPDLDARLPHHIGIYRDGQLWKFAQQIARSIDRQLLYDARGEAVLRTYPDRVRFSFTGQGHVLTDPVIDFDDDTTNGVIVVGADPKGPQNRIVAFALPRPSHPLHPDNIGRVNLPNGQVVKNTHLKTQAGAQARADRLLRDALRQAANVTFDSVPVPLFDPLDLCHVAVREMSVEFRLQKATLPLVLGGGDVKMPVGYRRRQQVTHAKRHPRHKAPRKHR